MDIFKEEQFSSAHLGHLGLVADKIDCLNIVDLIDRRLPVSKAYGAKISHGERVDALMMVMGLCLMVYGVSEYEVQQSLQEKNETIPNQMNKPTNTPSLRWVYFLF